MPRWLMFLAFFTVFITVWGSANYYIFKRGWQALRGHRWIRRTGKWQTRARRAYVALAVILTTAYVASRILDNVDVAGGQWLAAVLVWVGSIWMGFTPYLLLICLGTDLVRLGNRWFGYFPAGWADEEKRARVRVMTASIVITVVSIVNIAGFINALEPTTRTVKVTVEKPYKRGTLRIVMASDIHLGDVVGRTRLAEIVRTINAQDADLVLFPGDVVDDPLRPESDPEICQLLKSVQSRLGVFGATGNHEYIADQAVTVPFLEACGVSMLRDKVVKIDDGFYLAGREDVARDRMGEPGQRGRATLPDILSGIDRALPLILMDHTPRNLEAAERAGVDLQVSGHTHYAQLWPFQIITALIYEQDWGLHRRGDTQYYVSCGAGTWGPPVRTNSRSEVVVIDIELNGD